MAPYSLFSLFLLVASLMAALRRDGGHDGAPFSPFLSLKWKLNAYTLTLRSFLFLLLLLQAGPRLFVAASVACALPFFFSGALEEFDADLRWAVLLLFPFFSFSVASRVSPS